MQIWSAINLKLIQIHEYKHKHTKIWSTQNDRFLVLFGNTTQYRTQTHTLKQIYVHTSLYAGIIV